MLWLLYIVALTIEYISQQLYKNDSVVTIMEMSIYAIAHVKILSTLSMLAAGMVKDTECLGGAIFQVESRVHAEVFTTQRKL